MSERHCPICGDVIPATAHRLKKLCGKPECMLEQQRRSSRKSYHKVLGHTEPEKRECVVCGTDITELDARRKVCTNPACKKEIKRRGGYAYFDRNRNDPVFRAKLNVAAARYRAAKPRKCIVCRVDISDRPPGERLCDNPDCSATLLRLRQRPGRPRKAPVERIPRKPRPTVVKPPKRLRSVVLKAKRQVETVRRPRIIEPEIPWAPQPSGFFEPIMNSTTILVAGLPTKKERS